MHGGYAMPSSKLQSSKAIVTPEGWGSVLLFDFPVPFPFRHPAVEAS